jgi:hypothetical protein
VLASLVAGAVFVISFAAGVALVIIFPTLAAEYAEPIPAKYLLVQLNLIVSALAAFIVYWQLRQPLASRVVLGVLRMCYVTALGLLATPAMIFGFEKLSVVITGTMYIDVSIGDSAAWSVPGAVACVFCARWCARDYREIREFESTKGVRL